MKRVERGSYGQIPPKSYFEKQVTEAKDLSSIFRVVSNTERNHISPKDCTAFWKKMGTIKKEIAPSRELEKMILRTGFLLHQDNQTPFSPKQLAKIPLYLSDLSTTAPLPYQKIAGALKNPANLERLSPKSCAEALTGFAKAKIHDLRLSNALIDQFLKGSPEEIAESAPLMAKALATFTLRNPQLIEKWIVGVKEKLTDSDHEKVKQKAVEWGLVTPDHWESLLPSQDTEKILTSAIQRSQSLDDLLRLIGPVQRDSLNEIHLVVFWKKFRQFKGQPLKNPTFEKIVSRTSFLLKNREFEPKSVAQLAFNLQRVGKELPQLYGKIAGYLSFEDTFARLNAHETALVINGLANSGFLFPDLGRKLGSHFVQTIENDTKPQSFIIFLQGKQPFIPEGFLSRVHEKAPDFSLDELAEILSRLSEKEVFDEDLIHYTLGRVEAEKKRGTPSTFGPFRKRWPARRQGESTPPMCWNI